MTARTPNIALAALYEETGWSRGQFIRAIARVGSEVGVPFRYDESAVPHWLAGTLPRSPYAP